MNQVLLMMESVTYAMKGRALLNRRGIPASVERISHIGGGSGCGYGIKVPYGVEEAKEILAEAGIRVVRYAGREAP